MPELVRRDTEPLVHKAYGDSFEEIDLESVLAARGVGRLVVAGAETDACIRSTLHGVIVRRYDTTLVANAHTTGNLSPYGAPRRTRSSPTPTFNGNTRRPRPDRRHGHWLCHHRQTSTSPPPPTPEPGSRTPDRHDPPPTHARTDPPPAGPRFHQLQTRHRLRLTTADATIRRSAAHAVFVDAVRAAPGALRRPARLVLPGSLLPCDHRRAPGRPRAGQNSLPRTAAVKAWEARAATSHELAARHNVDPEIVCLDSPATVDQSNGGSSSVRRSRTTTRWWGSPWPKARRVNTVGSAVPGPGPDRGRGPLRRGRGGTTPSPPTGSCCTGRFRGCRHGVGR